MNVLQELAGDKREPAEKKSKKYGGSFEGERLNKGLPFREDLLK